MNHQKGKERKQSHLRVHRKYLGIDSTQAVKDLHVGNCKPLKKEAEEDTNQRKHMPCSRVGRINIVNVSVPPKALYRFNAVPTWQDAHDTSHRTRTNNPKTYVEPQRPQIATAILRKNGVGGITPPDSKLQYKHTAIKTAWHRHEKTHRSGDQTGEPRNKPTHL